MLLGFPENKVIAKGTYVDSGVVNITKHLDYITLACDVVDREKNTNRYGQKSTVVALLPVDTSQNLNGTFKTWRFSSETFSGGKVPIREWNHF